MKQAQTHSDPWLSVVAAPPTGESPGRLSQNLLYSLLDTAPALPSGSLKLDATLLSIWNNISPKVPVVVLKVPPSV